MSARTLAVFLLLVILALMPGLMMGYAVVSRTAPAISAVKSARARAVLDVVAGTVSTSPTLAATEERLEPEKLALKTELEKPAVVLVVRVPGSAVLEIDGPAVHQPDIAAKIQSP